MEMKQIIFLLTAFSIFSCKKKKTIIENLKKTIVEK